MGFHAIHETQPRCRALERVSPKTHTPDRHLHISGLRYYSPELGRWPSRDPIGERELLDKASESQQSASVVQGVDPDFDAEIASDVDTLTLPVESMMFDFSSKMEAWQQDGNLYQFCLNNPIVAIDPNGEWVQILLPIIAVAPRIIPVLQRVGPRVFVFFEYNGVRFSTWLGAAAARGTQIHSAWGARLSYGFQYNQHIPGVGRPDGINVVMKLIVELKPDNIRAIQLGVRTLENRYVPGCDRVLRGCFNGQLRPYQIIEQPGQFTPWFQNLPTP